MLGLGKDRSRFGMWLDRCPLSQIDFAKSSGVSRETISKLSSDNNYIPGTMVKIKILKAAKEIDSTVRSDMFWDL